MLAAWPFLQPHNCAPTLRAFIVPASSSIATAARKAGADFSKSVQERNGTQTLPPPHGLAAQAILTAIRDDPKIPSDIKTVAGNFLARGLTVNQVGQIILCRSSKCFQRDQVRIELHFLSDIPLVFEAIASAIVAVGGKECYGDAPRGPLERAVSEALNSPDLFV
ncbi:unnamed protein product [Polarella glacialis]|uniref:Uncharacterized protein n=1 Tax=Polarella glacialis TaxID=89957 RepID=A0A813K4Q9_POLGL|nr:unnamed protein product [Polarella glacialis]CAE8693881.1 unnamed protein product [Polarella glacialis]